MVPAASSYKGGGQKIEKVVESVKIRNKHIFFGFHKGIKEIKNFYSLQVPLRKTLGRPILAKHYMLSTNIETHTHNTVTTD